VVRRLIDALHLPPLDDDDAANDVTNEYEEYYLDGEPESSLVAGLRTGEDPDVHETVVVCILETLFCC